VRNCKYLRCSINNVNVNYPKRLKYAVVICVFRFEKDTKHKVNKIRVCVLKGRVTIILLPPFFFLDSTVSPRLSIILHDTDNRIAARLLFKYFVIISGPETSLYRNVTNRIHTHNGENESISSFLFFADSTDVCGRTRDFSPRANVHFVPIFLIFTDEKE